MTNTELIKKTLKYLLKCLICFVFEILALPISYIYKPKRNRMPTISDKILLIPAIELSKRIKKGELSSEQVVKSYIKQIERVNPIINAVVDKRFELALEESRRIDRQLADARNDSGDQSILLKPLVGVPFTTKETIEVENGSFSCGLPSRSFKRGTKNAVAVQKLVDAGMVPIAITNTPCMNLWWDSYNLLHGRTRNPYDLSKIPGGSSGGEAAILCTGGSIVGLASDLAGSIRIPANFCGVFGHKPTPFVVSTNGLFPKLRKDQDKLRGVGPMTRYAADLLPMLNLMVEDDKRPLLRLDEPVDLKKIKVFYCEDLGCPLVSRCDNDILSGLRAAAEYLSSTLRIPTQRVELEEFKYGLSLWATEHEVAAGKLYSTEDEDGIVAINPVTELPNCLLQSSDFPFNAIVCSIIERFGSKYGTPKHRYLSKKAAELRKRFEELVGDDGILMMPTHPQAAPHHLATVPKFLNVSYTAVANALQAPITQCPLGMTREGLPFGLQLIAKPYNDRILLAVAKEIEKAFGGWLPPARVSISSSM